MQPFVGHALWPCWSLVISYWQNTMTYILTGSWRHHLVVLKLVNIGSGNDLSIEGITSTRDGLCCLSSVNLLGIHLGAVPTKPPKCVRKSRLTHCGLCDVIWWHRSGSSLDQVMACCLMAPSHHLNQCWLIISVSHWYLAEGNFTDISCVWKLDYIIENTATSPRGQQVKSTTNYNQVTVCCHQMISHSLSQYCKTSNIRGTKSQILNDSHLVLQLFLPNPFQPGIKSKMKLQLEQRRQAMLQLHLSDQQVYCQLRCNLY